MSEFLYLMDKEKKEERIQINSYYVNNNLETVKKSVEIPYHLFINKEGFEKLNIKSKNIEIKNKPYLDINREEVLELEIKNKELYEYILEQTKEYGIKIYEADLPEEQKYLINKEIKINSSEKIPKLKYVAIDIETLRNEDSNKDEIILISIYSPNNEKINKVYINRAKIKAKKLKQIKIQQEKEYKNIIVENEEKLLLEFKKDLIEFEPQIIFGWNVIDFDFKVIKERFERYGIEFKFNKFEGKCHLKLNSDFFIDSSLICPGVIVFDVIHLLKSNYISFKDYKLDTVAKEVLKDEKLDLNFNDDSNLDSNTMEDKYLLIKTTWENNPNKLIEYNFKDSLLVSQIIEKLNLLELICKRSIITQTPIRRIKSPIACLDNMYLKELHKRGFVGNSNFNFTASAQIEGAFVIEPKKMLTKDIFVFDFKSLYPSIIMTFNIDPFTYSKNGEIVAPNGAKFERDKGILPRLINKLFKEREIAKKEKDEIKSMSLKITMNSFYGAMASPKSRFHNRDVGGAITSFGREIIKKTKAFVENEGYEVIYGDTDSIFVKIEGLENKNLKEKLTLGNKLKDKINKYFNKWIKNEFNLESYLEIELEKIYSEFFISSKKRYVGLNQLTGKIKFVGLEAVRGDWTEFAKKFQVELVELIFKNVNKKEIEKFILDKIEKLKKGEFDEELIYNKKLTKPLKEYTKTTPPHVKAAREVEKFEGRLVKYVITTEGPKHITKIGNRKLDYEHYIEKQMKGVSEEILALVGINFMELVKGKKQKSLSEFWG